MELQTRRKTSWQVYKPSEPALQRLAYTVNPRQQVLLSDLQPEMVESFVDMTCVLLWAGEIFDGDCSHVLLIYLQALLSHII